MANLSNPIPARKTTLTGGLVEPEKVKKAFFDAYEVGINLPKWDVVQKVAEVLRGEVLDLGPKKQWDQGMVLILRDGERVGWVKSRSQGTATWFGADGEDSQAICDLARGQWPTEHEVVRVDSTIDIDDGPGTFDRALRQFECVGERYGMSPDQEGDWLQGGIKGRTAYRGRRSNACLRLYEKGKKNITDQADLYRRLANFSSRGGKIFECEVQPTVEESQEWEKGFSPNLVRCEFQYRPQRLERVGVNRDTPAEIWGRHSAAHEMLSKVCNSFTLLNPIKFPHVPSLRKSIDAFFRQYSNTMRSALSSEERGYMLQKFKDVGLNDAPGKKEFSTLDDWADMIRKNIPGLRGA